MPQSQLFLHSSFVRRSFGAARLRIHAVFLDSFIQPAARTARVCAYDLRPRAFSGRARLTSYLQLCDTSLSVKQYTINSPWFSRGFQT